MTTGNVISSTYHFRRMKPQVRPVNQLADLSTLGHDHLYYQPHVIYGGRLTEMSSNCRCSAQGMDVSQ